MKILSIVGARPQFIKIAPLVRAIKKRTQSSPSLIKHVIVHTGQHYDPQMSDVFFSELELPQADYGLGVGSGPHGRQTGLMLSMTERVLLEAVPDIVVVYGDTNSTVAGALASAKLNIPVAHLEAGLRSFNRHMPEEINRIVADHVCDLLLAPTPTAMKNLKMEALSPRSVFTGDIMYDAVLFYRELAKQRSQIGERLALKPHRYAIVTVHRAENTDDLNNLKTLLSIFNEIASPDLPLIFPIHPRTSQRIHDELSDWQPQPHLRLIEPVGYLDMLWLLDHAEMALTDSGGLQKEAFFLGCPCITLREETEWIETVQGGGNILTGTDRRKIRAAMTRWQALPKPRDHNFSDAATASFGHGDAAEHVLDALIHFLEGNDNTSTDTLPHDVMHLPPPLSRKRESGCG
ncbi:MAG: UDP-N-acetylglucosamine 2-epimerase (non-hydrolyzing) [Pseudomonadota bacterium]